MKGVQCYELFGGIALINKASLIQAYFASLFGRSFCCTKNIFFKKTLIQFLIKYNYDHMHQRHIRDT